MAVSQLLSGCWSGDAGVFPSSFSGFGAFDRKEFFRCPDEPEGFGMDLGVDRSEEVEEVSNELRPALDDIRSNLAEADVGVDGRGVGECCSESSWEVTRTVEVLRRGIWMGALMTSGSFLFSFPNLDMDVDCRRRVKDSLRLLISIGGWWH